MASGKIEVQKVQGGSLYHLEDLPDDPQDYIPRTFSKMREDYGHIAIRDLVPTPKKGSLPFPETPDAQIVAASEFMPTLATFGFDDNFKQDVRSQLPFHGGEDSGQARLNDYIFEKQALATYADTRNELDGADHSSKLSPWLANGSLSIRDCYFQVKSFEEKFGESKSTKHFIDELFWREFCRLYCIYHETKVFYEYGPFNRDKY